MEDQLSWIRYQQIFGYGTTRGQKLLTRLGHPSVLFHTPLTRLASGGFLTSGELERFRQEGSEEAAQEIIDRCGDLGYEILTPDDEGYPQRLREIPCYPAAIYLRGSLEELDDCLAIGMVGTRKSTGYGNRAAEQIAGELAGKGVIIVSGLARGIDTVSHTAALKAGGRTIAVLGCGLDIVYPAENARLEELIIRYGGAVVTEYPPGTQPFRRHFPIRNRIISGLSNGIVVVEGDRHSGSLITAGHAFAQNRDVFAVPGSIFSEASSGPNYLLRQNAKAVDSVESILEEYQYLIQWEPEQGREEKRSPEPFPFEETGQGSGEEYHPKPKEPAPVKPPEPPAPVPVQETLPAYLTETQQQVYGTLSGEEAQTADYIVQQTGLPLPAVLAALTQMEIFGLVKIHPGRRFSL